MTTSPFSQFYKKKFDDRLQTLHEAGVLSDHDVTALRDGTLTLKTELAENMIENQFSTYTLPMGAAFHFLIDEKEYTVPMAIEEPSVVAAANYAAKVIGQAGGFTTSITKRRMIGQSVLKDIQDPSLARQQILDNKRLLLDACNAAHPSIVRRGGGARDLEVRLLEEDVAEAVPSFLVVHFFIDTLEAMGANIVNTMMEAVGPLLEDMTDGSLLMGILTNLATECLVNVTCTIPPRFLRTINLTGEEVRDRMIEASQLAWVDPYRAATNNKGIFNGIDAVVLASGNDWRAIEAGGHAYAATDGQYRSLSKWRKDSDGNLIGTLTLPMPVGSVGGSISIHPQALLTKRILGYKSAKELESIIVSVGLAQNFAALKAIVSEGIQRGHMSLHAKSLALSVGASGDEIGWVARELSQAVHMNQETAQNLLNHLRQNETKKTDG